MIIEISETDNSHLIPVTPIISLQHMCVRPRVWLIHERGTHHRLLSDFHQAFNVVVLVLLKSREKHFQNYLFVGPGSLSLLFLFPFIFHLHTENFGNAVCLRGCRQIRTHQSALTLWE